ncbi:tRNA (guanosine(37)-N1)-methyltransferase TrmD [Carboxylicivirga sp. M1479]|uniref:tRNA (guanosine(37)-N1)-methyltransferase TrmD n=1 Tax=Carboxylicivirga sp. M1479 TaxID=2594476 RepID=UPI001177BEAA|nr:tRNA (guanosine(37)-N1)-methyltransferase TrmD [Carboxylicivirga sp. M1479]TRX70771.1 tRNA (guanosine(37)-N1)-methyltransferase TrmD [Carboxylicivirga sp. M1479]
MRIDILTLFPEMFQGPLTQSIMKRAVDKGLVEMCFHDIRDYTLDKHKKVDDYAFGGGAGMVMTIQPIADLIEKLKAEREYEHVIYMTPDGQRFEQRIANSLSLCGNIMILCGHYKGVDQRVRDNYVTMEISIGDYVLTGGEMAAAVVSDAIIRLIPGVMSDETSALTDSFQDDLLSPPVYTRPADYNGWKVPDVLLSGNQAKIDEWREQEAYKRTKKIRPDLLDE